MCTYCITPLAKGLCDTPLVILTLIFHDLHPFLIYTPIPSVYAHPIFNCNDVNICVEVVEFGNTALACHSIPSLPVTEESTRCQQKKKA